MTQPHTTITWIEDVIRDPLDMSDLVFPNGCRVFSPDHVPPNQSTLSGVTYVSRPQFAVTTEDAFAHLYNTGFIKDSFDTVIVEDSNGYCLQRRIMPQALIVGKATGLLLVVGTVEPRSWLPENIIKISHHEDKSNGRCLTVFMLTDGSRKQTSLAYDLAFAQLYK
jgi:hypothetical protein